MRLAGILSLQGRYRSAELLSKQCVSCLQTTSGEENPRIPFHPANSRTFYIQEGQLSKAEKLSQQVYSRASKVFHLLNRNSFAVKVDFAYCIAIVGDELAAKQLLREGMVIGRFYLLTTLYCSPAQGILQNYSRFEVNCMKPRKSSSYLSKRRR